MLSIGIGELQKSISVFKNMTETIQIVDKRKKQVLAMVYPAKEHSVVKNLAGKYKNKTKNTNLSLDEIKEFSMLEAMKEKYGPSS